MESINELLFELTEYANPVSQLDYFKLLMRMESQKKIHLEKTLKGFTYNVLGVILPFILSLFPIFILGKYEAIWTFLDQGQFLLFGAGLYTSSIFLFDENLIFYIY